MTNFPGGVASFGLPILPGVPGGPVPTGPTLQSATTGALRNPVAYFVSSVIGSDGHPGTDIKRPLATFSKALAQALTGDTVYLMPGHVENIIAANGIDVTTAALNVIGLGSGNQRATFVFKTATTATFRVNAATGDGFYLYNVRFQSQIANLATCFTVAAKDVTFDTVDYYDDGTNDVAKAFVVTGVNCTLKNCSWQLGIANATVLQWVTLNAAHGFRCYGNYGYFLGLATANPANGVIVGVTAATKRVDIRGNFFSIDAGGTASVVISLFAASTGLVAYNGLNSTGKTAIAGINAIAAAMGYQNFVTHTANKSGLLDPVVDV